MWVEIGLNLALLVVLVAVLDAGVLYLVTRAIVVDTASAAAEGAARVVAEELGATPEPEWARVLQRHAKVGRLAVYSPAGAPVVGATEPEGRRVNAVVATREVESEVDGDEVVALAPIGAGRPVAVLELRLPREALDAPAWGVMVVHAAFSAVLVALFGWFLFRRAVLDPVDRMRGTTARIAAGEFGVRVSEEAPRELAELAGSLNRMSEALAAYQARTAEQVTRLEAANAELQRARDALVRSEKLASVGRLAAGLAHELGNPLTAVRGYVEILVDEEAPGAPQAALLRRAQVEVERMHGLLRHLLDFAREERRVVGPVAVRGLLTEAVETVRPQPAFRDVRVEVEIEGEPWLQGEAEGLHQALVNLLLNAAAAGAKAIRVSAAPVGGRVEIRVADDGEGIPPEHIGRIFDPFFTTREPGAGTGLGLAIVHRIVERHEGRIEVSSLPGQGATFRLTLDAARSSSG